MICYAFNTDYENKRQSKVTRSGVVIFLVCLILHLPGSPIEYWLVAVETNYFKKMTVVLHSFTGDFVLLIIGCCVLSVSASPSGAPEAACTTMTPQHGVGWQNTTCPFEIIVDKVSLIFTY